MSPTPTPGSPAATTVPAPTCVRNSDGTYESTDPAYGCHVVVRGESLGQIAAEYDTTLDRLANLNRMSGPDVVFPGQVLVVPQGQTAPTFPSLNNTTTSAQSTAAGLPTSPPVSSELTLMVPTTSPMHTGGTKEVEPGAAHFWVWLLLLVIVAAAIACQRAFALGVAYGERRSASGWHTEVRTARQASLGSVPSVLDEANGVASGTDQTSVVVDRSHATEDVRSHVVGLYPEVRAGAFWPDELSAWADLRVATAIREDGYVWHGDYLIPVERQASDGSDIINPGETVRVIGPGTRRQK